MLGVKPETVAVAIESMPELGSVSVVEEIMLERRSEELVEAERI